MDWLKREMIKRGVSQKSVGEAAGLSEVQMSKVMAGARKLSADEAAAIWRSFGYTLPDDDASDADVRILQKLSLLSEDEKTALEVLLRSLGSGH